LSQIVQTHNENKISEDNEYEYLGENELFGLILMMMFKSESELTSA
jgi:hypothetical protein